MMGAQEYAFSSGAQTGQAAGFEISGPHTIAVLRLVATISTDARVEETRSSIRESARKKK
jgi:hypothetical protein